MVLSPETCPAAHSMDTKWFAVDADGFVGRFDTGEGGALPTRAAATPEGGDLDPGPLYVVLAARALVRGEYPEDDPAHVLPPLGPGLVVLEDAPSEESATYREAGAKLEASLGATVLHDESPRILHVRDPDVMERIGADPRIARFVPEDEIFDWAWEGGGGVFHYGNDEWGNPGAYARHEDPEDPLALTDVPDEMRDAIGAMVLALRFAESPTLHLADHIETKDAAIWGDTDLHGEPIDGLPIDEGDRTEAVTRLQIILIGILLALGILWLILR